MSALAPRQVASPGPLVTRTTGERRCARCGASRLEIAENPVTKKIQCRVCGAPQSELRDVFSR